MQLCGRTALRSTLQLHPTRGGDFGCHDIKTGKIELCILHLLPSHPDHQLLRSGKGGQQLLRAAALEFTGGRAGGIDIRGMIERGDRHHDIASFFGVNQGRIAEVKEGKRFSEIPSADREELPPKGPYLTPKATWMENRLR